MLKISHIIDVLKSDFEDKKEQSAYTDTICDVNGCFIDQGDSFYFFGNAQKCCPDCYHEIVGWLEEEEEKAN